MLADSSSRCDDSLLSVGEQKTGSARAEYGQGNGVRGRQTVLSNQELFHGAAFARLFRLAASATVTHAAEIHPSAYRIEIAGRRSAILFKVNRVRKKSPWQFTFTQAEHAALCLFHHDFPDHRRFVALICRLDGVCCLSEDQLFLVLNAMLDGRAVSVRRPRRGSYRVSGPDGVRLRQAVPQGAWPGIL